MKIIIGLFIIMFVAIACSQAVEVSKSDPLESGRGFIESSLKGDYDEARKYILPDSSNIQYFNGMKDSIAKEARPKRKATGMPIS